MRHWLVLGGMAFAIAMIFIAMVALYQKVQEGWNRDAVVITGLLLTVGAASILLDRTDNPKAYR